MLNGEETIFNIWDTAGEEKTNSLSTIYYRHAVAAIIVFDASNP